MAQTSTHCCDELQEVLDLLRADADGEAALDELDRLNTLLDRTLAH